MSRSLPARPNLEHLKSQAKDLLAAHRRGDKEALGRIRASLPSCASLSLQAVAKRPFALHDAQSAVAREYGAASWAELRARVRAAEGHDPPVPAAQPTVVSLVPKGHFSAALESAVVEARAKIVAGPVRVVSPDQLPALPLRNALVVPGAAATIQITRPSSLRAVEAAEQHEPPLLCVIVQRESETDAPEREDLHDVGCLCRLLARRSGESGSVWLVVEGIRWITLMSLESTSPFYVARVAELELDPSEGGAETIARLDQKLRERSHALAMAALPKESCEQALALIDVTKDPERLANLVLANLTCTPEEQADYAERTDLVQRLERVIELVEREFTLPL